MAAASFAAPELRLLRRFGARLRELDTEFTLEPLVLRADRVEPGAGVAALRHAVDRLHAQQHEDQQHRHRGQRDARGKQPDIEAHA